MKVSKSVSVGLCLIIGIVALVCCVSSQSKRGSDFKLFDVYRNYNIVTARLCNSSTGYEKGASALYSYEVNHKSYTAELSYSGKNCKVLVDKDDPQHVTLKSKYNSNLLCTVLACLAFSELIIALVLYLVFIVSNN